MNQAGYRQSARGYAEAILRSPERTDKREQITAAQRAKLERERRKHRERDWRRHVATYTAEFVGTLIVTLGSFAPVVLEDGLGFQLGYVAWPPARGSPR